MFVITGSLGNTGSVVVESLREAGQKVRAIVRDVNAPKAQALAAKGVDVVAADLHDAEALRRAFEGAKGVYLLSPPDAGAKDFVADRARFFQRIAEVVRAAKVPHVVLLSSIGAQHADGTGVIRSTYEAERALAASGAATTFVRAAYFIENWAGVLPAARGDGVLPSFLAKDRAIPMAATRDIGKVAARALLDGPKPGGGARILELASVDASPSDVAAALARILGRPVTVAEAPLSAVVPTFTSFGLSPEASELYRQMYAGIADGTVAWATSGTERVRGEVKLDDTLRALLGA